ncbi:MAG: hypothetical protein C5B49_11995 [Bdellovibrio sp.]|nr:MAG: hypothetical protein C5B49_11995 [Bdellovibrio sp.]
MEFVMKIFTILTLVLCSKYTFARLSHRFSAPESSFKASSPMCMAIFGEGGDKDGINGNGNDGGGNKDGNDGGGDKGGGANNGDDNDGGDNDDEGTEGQANGTPYYGPQADFSDDGTDIVVDDEGDKSDGGNSDGGKSDGGEPEDSK